MLPLAGIRVLDLSRLLPGPYCSMVLADFGADVIKVEDTDHGDYMREMPGMAGAFASLNRNKRSLALNLKERAGQEVFYRLAQTADVVLEGFRPGVAARLGIDYPTLQKHNPRLIYCSLTGYGQTGPRSGRAGHDINYMALAGALDLTGDAGGPPVVPGVQVADLGGGAMWALAGILVALLARQQTGEGQHIDVAMLDGVIGWQVLAASALFTGGALPGRGTGVLNGSYACYRIYQTSDGGYLSLGALEPKFWAAFCQRLGRPDLIARQFVPAPGQGEVVAEVQRILLTGTRQHWVDFFAGVDCCLEPVLNLAEVFADGHVQARGMEVANPAGTGGSLLAVPVKLSATPGAVRSPAPGWGEDSAYVLAAAGFSSEEITALQEGGVVGGAGGRAGLAGVLNGRSPT